MADIEPDDRVFQGDDSFVFHSISVLPVSEGSTTGPKRRHQRRCWNRTTTAAFLFRDVPRGHRALRGVIECASSGCLSFTFLSHNGCSCCNVCVWAQRCKKGSKKTANFRWHLIISGLFSSRHLLPSLFYFIHRHLSLSNRTKGPTF